MRQTRTLQGRADGSNRTRIVTAPIFDPAVEAASNRRARRLFFILLGVLIAVIAIFLRYGPPSEWLFPQP